MSHYPKVALQSRRVRSEIVSDGCVRDAFNQSGAEQGCRDAKYNIRRVGEIRLADRTAGRCVPTSGDCKYGMNASVRCPIRIADESHLSDRAVEGEERRNRVAWSHNGRPHNLRIVCRRTRPSDRWMNMASRARIEIESRPQTVVDTFHLCKLGDTWFREKVLALVMDQPGKRLARPRGAAADSRVYGPGCRRGGVLEPQHCDSRKAQRRRRNYCDKSLERYRHRDLSNLKSRSIHYFEASLELPVMGLAHYRRADARICLRSFSAHCELRLGVSLCVVLTTTCSRARRAAIGRRQ